MEDQACLEALAAFLRSDATSAGRCLSRVSRANLAARLLPAARALAQAADLVLTEPALTDGSWPSRAVELDYALSPACLLGMCTGSAPGNPCTSSPCASATCQHSCHYGRTVPRTYSAGLASRGM
jgi:hypothetical protein